MAYELQVLLELREQARESAEDALAEQNALLNERQQDVTRARQAHRAAVQRKASEVAAFDERVATGAASMGELRMFEGYKRGLAADIEEALAGVERARQAVRAQEKEVARAQQHLGEAVRELEAVQQHHDAWAQEQRVLEQRKQEAAMDEIAARLWREKNQ